MEDIHPRRRPGEHVQGGNNLQTSRFMLNGVRGKGAGEHVYITVYDSSTQLQYRMEQVHGAQKYRSHLTFATGPLAKCTTQQSLEVPSSSSRKISARVANQKQGNDATTTLRKQGRTNQRHDYFQERNDEAGAWDRIGCRTYSIAIQVDPTSSMSVSYTHLTLPTIYSV